jgi:hypothetical protein
MALVLVYCCVVLLVFCSINKHKYMVFCTTFFRCKVWVFLYHILQCMCINFRAMWVGESSNP